MKNHLTCMCPIFFSLSYHAIEQAESLFWALFVVGLLLLQLDRFVHRSSCKNAKLLQTCNHAHSLPLSSGCMHYSSHRAEACRGSGEDQHQRCNAIDRTQTMTACTQQWRTLGTNAPAAEDVAFTGAGDSLF